MATYKHIRSATANKRPTTSIADGQLAINTNTASPGLFFKDSAGTGIVKVGPVHVGTTAPNSTPAAGGSSGNYLGEQWLDTSVSPAQMKVWNGSTWVGIVADELPVSKLQDGTAGQIVQTDSAGTGVEWSSTANLPVGSASVPAYRFQGDANTGLYSPGADQLAISTGGTQRLLIEADGDINIDSGGVFYDATNNRLAIGTTTPNYALDVVLGVGIQEGQAVNWHDGSGSNSAQIYGDASDNLIFRNTSSNTERARIDSSGRLLVGTSTATGIEASLVSVGASAANFFRFGTDNCTVKIGSARGTQGSPSTLSFNEAIGTLQFTGHDGTSYVAGAHIRAVVDGGVSTGDFPTRLVFSTTADGASSPTERMRISSSGNVYIGTTVGTAPFTVAGTNIEVRNTNGAYVNNSQVTSVSTSATTIVADAGFQGRLWVINGAVGNDRFCDLVMASTAAAPVVVQSFTAIGSPAARTYTRSGSALQLAMASGTYEVRCIGMGA